MSERSHAPYDFHGLGTIYTHPERWTSFASYAGVPLITEKVVERSTAKEAGASGGLFGILQGASKLGKGEKVTTKEVIPESALIREACINSLRAMPPKLTMISSKEDWGIVDESIPIFVYGKAQVADWMSIPYEFVHPSTGEKITTNLVQVYIFHIKCAGKTVEIHGHTNHIRKGTLWTHMVNGLPVQLGCVGILNSKVRARKVELTPIVMGFPRSFELRF